MWKRSATAILMIGVSLRLLMLVLNFGIEPTSRVDASKYYQQAINIHEGNGYEGSAFWPVGWPLVLAGVFALVDGPSVVAGQIVNVAFSTLTLVSLYAIGVALLSQRTALIAMALMAVYPSFIAYAVELSSETFATSMMLAGFALVLHRRAEWFGGLCLGFAMLARPQFLPILAMFTLWYLWHWRMSYVASFNRVRTHSWFVGSPQPGRVGRSRVIDQHRS